jgi:hypothetical protein
MPGYWRIGPRSVTALKCPYGYVACPGDIDYVVVSDLDNIVTERRLVSTSQCGVGYAGT